MGCRETKGQLKKHQLKDDFDNDLYINFKGRPEYNISKYLQKNDQYQ